MKNICKISTNSAKTKFVFNSQVKNLSNYESNLPQGKPGVSICDCAGCIWEDGGGGFTVGMMLIQK